MDFSTLLKGATDTLKKLDTDLNRPRTSDSVPDSTTESTAWQPWVASEDDGWEDVTDVSLPSTTNTQPTASQSTPERNDTSVENVITKTQNLHVKPVVSTLDISSNHTTPEKSNTGNVNQANNKTEKPDLDQVERNKDQNETEQSSQIVTKPNGTSTAEVESLKAQLKDAQNKISATERKVFALTRDRDALRRIRDSRNSDAQLVKDKDKQIAAIMAEAEQLSIKIQSKEEKVRTVKQESKEKDEQIQKLRQDLAHSAAKVTDYANRHRKLETSEKAAQDSMEAAEKRLRQIESDARSKSTSSAALEAARAQLETLRKSHSAALETQAMRMTAEKEMSIEALTKKSKISEDALNKAMMELREHLSQVVDNAGWREDQLRKEADELRKRAEQLEARNEELAAALPDATRPLLRQVEALQAAASERVRAKSAVDRSQLERLRAAEAALATAEERERAAEDRIGSLMTRAATLEEQVKISQAEQSRLSADNRKLQSEAAEVQLRHQRELEAVQNQILKATRDKEKATEELSKERTNHLDAIEAMEEREKQLQSQLAAVEARLEMTQDNLAKATVTRDRRNSSLASLTSPGLKRFDSMGNVSSASINFVGSDYGDDTPTLGESTSGVYATERMASTLRQRNGEVASLQAQLDSKEAATQALAEEVITLTAKVDELTKEKTIAPELRKEFSDLKSRHETLLQLFGEREERINELEADLADVNQMYKEQVTELLMRIEKLSS